MSIISIKNVSKIYKTADIEVKAVDNVSIEIQKGEFTAIVGPSGSGKTTLLNLIGGLDKVTDGQIILDQTDITKLKDNDLINFRLKNIGFVFQAYNLIPVLTAYENVEFIMSLQGMPKKQREQRVLELLTSVELAERKNNRPSQLSGGQQQRVAVARALAPKPKFVLADEPTANLDSVATENLLNIMKKLNEQEGITFVFSTHDQRVINKAKRIIILQDGRVIEDKKQ